MRNLLFKNLTSEDRRRKIISSTEILDKQGVRSIIHRHFVCMVKELNKGDKIKQPEPAVYVLKEHNTREQKERFFCKIKGSVLAVKNNRLFLILFIHSLKINLTPASEAKQLFS